MRDRKLVSRAARLVPPLVLAATALAVHWNRQYTSDDVGLQLLLRTWRPGRQGIVGSDTLLLRAPLYWAMDVLLPPSPSAILLEGFLLQLGGFLLLVAAARRFARLAGGDQDVAAIWTIWFAALGGTFADVMLRPNHRGLECGLALYLASLIAWTIAYWRVLGPWQRAGRMAALACAIALLDLDDPLSVLVVIVPYVGVRLLLPGSSSARMAAVGTTAVGLLLAGSGRSGLDHVGLHAKAETHTLTDPAAWRDAVGATGHAVAQALGGRLGDGSVAPARLATNLTLVAAAAIVALIARGEQRQALFPLAALPLAGTLLYAVTDPAIRPGTERYLFPAIAAAALVVAVIAATSPRVRLVLGLLLIATLAVNVVPTIYLLRHGNRVRDDQAALVADLRAIGVRRGYGDFWAANLLTYRSSGRLDILPVLCPNGRLRPRRAFIDASRFRIAARASFLLVGPGDGCAQSVPARLGPPLREISLSSGYRALVYPFDLLEDDRPNGCKKPGCSEH